MEAEHGKGIRFLFMALEMLGKSRIRGNLGEPGEIKGPSNFFLMIVLHAGRAVVGGKGQPTHTVRGMSFSRVFLKSCLLGCIKTLLKKTPSL